VINRSIDLTSLKDCQTYPIPQEAIFEDFAMQTRNLLKIMAGLGLVVCHLTQAAEFRIGCYDGYAPKELTDKFIAEVKAKMGKDITVSVKTVGNNDDVFNAIRGNQSDVASVTNNALKAAKFPYISQNLIMAIDTSKLTHYKELLPSLQNAEYITEGGKTYGTPLNYGQYGLAYNTGLVKQAPTSWNDLFQPGITFAASSDWYDANIYTAALAAGVSKADIFTLEKINTPAVKEKLKILAKANKFWVGVDDAATLKGLMMATSWNFALPGLAQQGEVWKMAEPKEGVTGYVDNFSINHAIKPEMMDVAMAWLDFTLAPEQQAYYYKTIGVKPVNPHIKNLLNANEALDAKIDDPSWFGNHITLLKAADLRMENAMKNMWNDAKAGK
jgi:spermidine/putrescine transport system substrate-binding protein